MASSLEDRDEAVRILAEHRTFSQWEGRRRVYVARCSCGWVGTVYTIHAPTVVVSADAADHQVDQIAHLLR